MFGTIFTFFLQLATLVTYKQPKRKIPIHHALPHIQNGLVCQQRRPGTSPILYVFVAIFVWRKSSLRAEINYNIDWEGCSPSLGQKPISFGQLSEIALGFPKNSCCLIGLDNNSGKISTIRANSVQPIKCTVPLC